MVGTGREGTNSHFRHLGCPSSIAETAVQTTQVDLHLGPKLLKTTRDPEEKLLRYVRE